MQAARRRIYEFGPFRLNESERRFVEEVNLNRSISTVRKALGESAIDSRFIETVPKRGYRFTANVVEVFDEEPDLILEKRTSAEIITEEEEEITDSTVAEAGRSFANNPRAAVVASRANLIRALRLPSVAISGAVAVASIALILFWTTGRQSRAGSTSNIKSIAVLPLQTFNETPDDKALSLGFADALITSLGKFNEVRVISINAVSHYTDLEREPVEIGKNLDVDSVFDGTLQRANGKFRVTLRLIRTSDGKQIWSGSFDENESDIFHLQDAMSLRTAQALALNLRTKDAKRPTENREAYRAYLLGRFFFDKRSPEDYDKAAAEFKRAIALNPSYALAYTGLADVYAMQANIKNGGERDALYEKSRATATTALELDERLAEAHTSLGWVKRVHDWDWTGSEREFRRALELNPNDVNAHQWYALLLITLGRLDEALSETEQARELAPLTKIVLQNNFAIRQYRREFEELPALAQQIVSLDDSQPANARTLSIAYTKTGNYAKAIEVGEAYQAASQGRIGAYIAANQAVTYARMGQNARSREMLEYLEQGAKDDSEFEFRLAMADAELERAEEAIKHLQRCFTAHDDRLVWLRVESCFDSLRSDPRFQELLRKMKLDSSSIQGTN